MKNKLLIFLLLTTILISSGFTMRHDLIAKATWLIGTWENKNKQGSLYETWKQASAHELSGKSYFIEKKDTVVVETVQLLEKDHKLYYIVTTINQNDDKPVSFASTTVTDNEMIFENPQHDFPSKIWYKKLSSDSLMAEISGAVSGKETRQSFPMKKLK